MLGGWRLNASIMHMMENGEGLHRDSVQKEMFSAKLEGLEALDQWGPK